MESYKEKGLHNEDGGKILCQNPEDHDLNLL
jgi:hypothetical protein